MSILAPKRSSTLIRELCVKRTPVDFPVLSNMISCSVEITVLLSFCFTRWCAYVIEKFHVVMKQCWLLFEKVKLSQWHTPATPPMCQRWSLLLVARLAQSKAEYKSFANIKGALNYSLHTLRMIFCNCHSFFIPSIFIKYHPLRTVWLQLTMDGDNGTARPPQQLLRVFSFRWLRVNLNYDESHGLVASVYLFEVRLANIFLSRLLILPFITNSAE